LSIADGLLVQSITSELHSFLLATYVIQSFYLKTERSNVRLVKPKFKLKFYGSLQFSILHQLFHSFL